MAETKKIVLEGDVTLAYFADEDNSKHILLKPEPTRDGPVANAVANADSPEGGERLEAKIANELHFPDDAEFDAIFQKLDEMQQNGMRPAKDTPTWTREGVRLRITVEVLP